MKVVTIALLSIGVVGAVVGGIGVGKVVAGTFKPDTTEYLVDEVQVDVESALAAYNDISKGNKDYTKLSPDQAVQVAFHRFGQEEQNYSIGVGSSLASIVKQTILARSAKNGEECFEESISLGLVNIHDRMFQKGDNIDTYWGEGEDYAAHPKVSYSGTDYALMMGRQVKESLVYIVAPETLNATSLSGDPLSGISKEDDGYKIEIELDPVKGVANYQKQMQTISDLAAKPSFTYCHLTVYTDANLDLKRFETHESYFAKTKAGVGSVAEGRLNTLYYHNTLPEEGFPKVDSPSYNYPESL
ncbi:MAG: hypothetical protein K6B65_03205 [Bacilli bacterium]|nr:hypothetical protein [Bacilli bacterium]